MTTDTTQEIKVVFLQTGDFKALYAAEDWCHERGISMGSVQRGSPRGLMRGDFDIEKWRNLSPSDRYALDGRMTGDMRNGPVIINIKEESA